jgi:tetratricopeptide (TPR) repeat protein
MDIMRKSAWKLVGILLFIPFLTSCVKLALQLSPSLIPNLTRAFFEECYPDLAKQSMPADLKLMEGLLKNDPKNRQLLTALCMGFTGYAMLFVEEKDPERASQLYLRARGYGLKALGGKAPLSKEANSKKEIILRRLMAVREGEIEALFWTAMSWNAWIKLNFDKPVALAQLSVAQACLERVLEIKPDYFYGAPYVLMGSVLAARPESLGGNAAQSKACFEEAMHLSDRKFFMVHYYYARYYAVRVQNKELFLKLIKEISSSPLHGLKEVCLINAVMKQKTKHLMAISEDLFF